MAITFTGPFQEFHVDKNQRKIFDSNLILASGVLLSGNSYTKI